MHKNNLEIVHLCPKQIVGTKSKTLLRAKKITLRAKIRAQLNTLECALLSCGKRTFSSNTGTFKIFIQSFLTQSSKSHTGWVCTYRGIRNIKIRKRNDKLQNDSFLSEEPGHSLGNNTIEIFCCHFFYWPISCASDPYFCFSVFLTSYHSCRDLVQLFLELANLT